MAKYVALVGIKTEPLKILKALCYFDTTVRNLHDFSAINIIKKVMIKCY